jgi:polyhydroxyalkanoate synthesis regulator phasin
MEHLDKLYFGAFIRYIDKNNVMYYGGYLVDITSDSDRETMIMISDTINSEKPSVRVNAKNLIQIYKKVDQMFFEMLAIQSNMIVPLQKKISKLEAQIQDLQNKR